MEFRVGSVSDIGRRRSQNQDSYVARPELGLFVVADGMGGHRGGEIASAMAIEAISKTIEKAGEGNPSVGLDAKAAISDAISLANRAIFEHSNENAELEGMGTTVTAMLLRQSHLTVGHVGDSRCYFLRPGTIWQVTRDHSLVQEKLRAGIITRADVKTDQMKNVITRSVGYEPNLRVETYEMSVRPGDFFLICSDGLTGQLEDTDIQELFDALRAKDGSPQKIAQALIDAANAHGGDDNITGVLVEIVTTDG